MMTIFRKFTRAAVLGSAFVLPSVANADDGERIVILREGKSVHLNDGSFTFKLLKIRGYSVDVRFDGEKRRLKFGDSLSSVDADCSVRFEEISPETRIARFRTDCP